MPVLYRTLTLSERRMRNGLSTIPFLVLTALFLFNQPAKAIQTSTYVFDPNQSTVVKTGGFAGVHETYSIAGQFCSSVDYDAGFASFEKVDANLIDQEGSVYAWDLGTIFNMTALPGAVVDDTTIRFEGKTADGTESDILLTVSFTSDSAHLTGTITPPPHSADMFSYELSAVVSKKYAGGTGEPNSPYQIATAADLIALGESPEDYDKHFILTSDIDLDPNLPGRKVFSRAVIGVDGEISFTGVFDGNGYMISHMTIVGGGYLGLFGRLGSGTSVRDLALVDVNITSSGGHVGGLVGCNSGHVTHCYSTGTVNGNRRVGGLVGSNEGFVTECYSTSAVSSPGGSVGGLVGLNSDWSFVTDCYSTGAVNGDDPVGGLVGANESSYVTRCYSTGAVRGQDLVGGLVGLNVGWSHVTGCHGTGTVSGDDSVGGLVGANGRWSHVTGCYGTGGVRGDDSVGGLVGENGGDATHCYSAGMVQGRDKVGGLVGLNGGRLRGCDSCGDVGGDNNIGGLVGYNNGDVTHCYSASSVDGGSSVGGLVGLNSYWITCCYSTGTISGSSKIGGLAGANTGMTSNCYATGPATGDWDVGGLVGHNGTGTITNCYSVGLITGRVATGGLVGSNESGQISSSFWDIQTSHRTNSAGGTGKNTSQMSTAEIFLATGWDFVGEIENGTEDIWWILKEQDYPDLVWNSRAVSPHPGDGATEVQQPLILTWIVGNDPLYQDVYLGEDEEVVANATTQSLDTYGGRQAAEMTTFDPGTLGLSKTYYWRIDGVNEADPSSPWKGKVWSFTTADHILVLVVGDFESYLDRTRDRIWQVWIDGYDNGTGSQVGYFMPPYCEQRIVHGGQQSMPLFYDNDGTVYEGSDLERQALFYSEAVRPFDSPWDWTINDADTLTLYFRGEADNDPDSLYVGIEDSASRIAVMTHPDADAVLTTEWQKWHIPLVDWQAAGVDLTSVLKIYIGVGDRNNPQPGGAGLIYIDDIRVTNRMP